MILMQNNVNLNFHNLRNFASQSHTDASVKSATLIMLIVIRSNDKTDGGYEYISAVISGKAQEIHIYVREHSTISCFQI
jgi:hypothetical protein